MKHLIRSLLLTISAFAFFGCATVDITKTGKGYHPPTNPNEVQILMTVPTQSYEELGTLTVNGFKIREEAKMHNAIRAKAAPLGANAVVIQSQGMVPDGFGNGQRWCTGVAIRIK
jgi:hypothetical protein